MERRTLTSFLDDVRVIRAEAPRVRGSTTALSFGAQQKRTVASSDDASATRHRGRARRRSDSEAMQRARCTRGGAGRRGGGKYERERGLRNRPRDQLFSPRHGRRRPFS
ncbi:hypothetical protein MRX96_019739 [Rhipicephalus microplus]